MKTLHHWPHRLLALAVVIAGVQHAAAHCQIPCGIYGDRTRFTLMEEHITTMDKSMQQVMELSDDAEANANQLVRWVNNKEEHAEAFSEIVTYYFMAQRIKPVDEADTKAHAKYVRELTLLHRLLVYAMKAKQTTDLDFVAELRATLHAFERSYMGDEKAATHDH